MSDGDFAVNIGNGAYKEGGYDVDRQHQAGSDSGIRDWGLRSGTIVQYVGSFELVSTASRTIGISEEEKLVGTRTDS